MLAVKAFETNLALLDESANLAEIQMRTWSAPDKRAWAVHLASLLALFFNSVASTCKQMPDNQRTLSENQI